ncbi:MAG: DNA/RNA nuclease SfsA, partial [Pseudanabaena sp.]
MSQVHTYADLISGRLVSRYKRFFADIELDNGELITAHCANTGPMTGVCKIGSPVLISHHSNPKRKLA